MDQTLIDFDEEWYLLTYPDVAKAVAVGEFDSAVQHFLHYGQQEGRRPCPVFDAAAYPLDGDLLRPGPIREVRLDLTSRCNLRCVYCAVSQPWYEARDMNPAVLQKLVPAIVAVAAHNQLDYLSVSGHGETTFMPGWTEAVGALIGTGLPATITTNLAKEYTEEELRVLGRLKAVAVSIDTCNRELLRRMRRHVDVRQIVTNIALIRAAALDAPPEFYFLSGLYDQNSLHLEAFARFAAALGIKSMGFWDLTRYDYAAAEIAEGDRPRPLDELPLDELRTCIECIAKGFAILRAHHIDINPHGDWIYRLADKVGMHV